MIDEQLLHLDDLQTLSERAATAHKIGVGEFDYERFGICTPDLIYTAKGYGQEMLQQASDAGLGLQHALLLLFLAGFDLGYQARLELESRGIVGSEVPDFDRPAGG